ncbi:conserved hypothetical protein [Vibrio phage 501E54-1]|nr:conserved hypothetical protein [Vibrio phage 501E54-1]
MEELLYFVHGMVYVACLSGLIRSFTGDTLAVDSHTWDVKLHSREDGKIYTWKKWTKTTPTVYFVVYRVWRR